MKWLFRNFGYKLLAAGVALLLWGVSHGTKPIERGFDVPMALRDVPDDLVVTDQSTDAVNIRVKGSQAALRSLTVADIQYVVSGCLEGFSYQLPVSVVELFESSSDRCSSHCFLKWGLCNISLCVGFRFFGCV